MAARREGGVWVNDSDEPATIVMNSDGTAIGSSAAADGLAITNETLEAGGLGNLGWLSSIRLAIKERLFPYVAGGAAVASPTGLALMHFDASNVPRQVNATNPLAVQQAALARTQDAVAVSQQTDALMSAGVALPQKFAIIDAASSGDNTLLAAVSSKKIRVLSLWMIAAGAVTVRFESGAGGTALSGQANVAANGGFVLNYSPLGHFETASNTLLNLELSGAVSVDGAFTYIEV